MFFKIILLVIQCQTPTEDVEFLDYLSINMIKFYKKNISPLHCPMSHFRPTSSSYALDAIEKYGFFKGFIMGCDRLMRENSEEWIYPTKVENEIIYKIDRVD